MVHIDHYQYLTSCFCKSGMTKIIDVLTEHPCEIYAQHQNNPNLRDRLRNPAIFREQLCQNLTVKLLCNKGMCPISRKIFPTKKEIVPIEYVESNSRCSDLTE